jgi:hypothetical protein
MDLQQESNKQESSLFDMNLNVQNSANLRSAASWARVLGVCGILLGFLLSFLFLYTYTKLNSYDYSYRRTDSIWANGMAYTKGGLILMVLVGVIFILGGIFSYGFGNKILAALKSNDDSTLNRGFASLRNYFATRSLTLIIVLLLLLLSMLGSM